MNTHTNNPNKSGTMIAIVIVVLLVVIAGAYFLDASRNSDTKLGRATDEFVDNAERGRIAEGAEEASEEFKDRTTGEKVGDAIEDAGRDIQDAAHDAAN